MKTSMTQLALVFIISIFGMLILIQSAVAGQAADSDFEPIYRDEQVSLVLSGIGVLKYMGFIRIYDGAFYLPPDVPGDRALEDVAKRLEVKYLRSFKAEDFGTAAIAGIRKNLGPDAYDHIEPRIHYHNGLYENIVTGDRVSLTYIPSIGTRVGINGITKGTIQGADFAAALFSLWLGDKPFDGSFKRALLGGK
jgi:hypothetical protein